MELLVSQPNPQGHVVVARVPEGSVVLARFEGEAEPRDVTGWLADLVLIGLSLNHEAAVSGSLPPAEEVEVAVLEAEGDPVSFVYAHPSSGAAAEFDWVAAAPLVGKGIAFQITAGVAHEAEEVPDDASSLDEAPGA